MITFKDSPDSGLPRLYDTECYAMWKPKPVNTIGDILRDKRVPTPQARETGGPPLPVTEGRIICSKVILAVTGITRSRPGTV
jgi:hypothetical protein